MLRGWRARRVEAVSKSINDESVIALVVCEGMPDVLVAKIEARPYNAVICDAMNEELQCVGILAIFISGFTVNTIVGYY